MKILSGKQIRETDAYTIAHEPITSEGLMERAAKAFTDAFIETWSVKWKIVVFCGCGNNGGDGLAIARMLLGRKYHVDVYIVKTSDQFSKDFLINEERLTKLHASQVHLADISNLTDFEKDTVVIDAIFGTGLNRPAEGIAATVINAINDLNLEVVSVDIPSGLYTDNANHSTHGFNRGNVIKAQQTFTFQLPKLSFFFCSNVEYVGNWKVLDISLDKDFIESRETNYFYTTSADARNILKPRLRCSNKGSYGHALVWAGSYGKIGAAQLSV